MATLVPPPKTFSGVASMKIGERAVFTMSPDYGYGKIGSPPKIPGDATLKFDIELFASKEEEVRYGRSSIVTNSEPTLPNIVMYLFFGFTICHDDTSFSIMRNM